MRIVASGQVVPPLGGIRPLPEIASLYSVSLPCAMRGAQAALSPALGAPLRPVPWQAEHTCLKASSPVAGTAAADPDAPPAVAGMMASALLSCPAIASRANGAVFCAVCCF